MPDLKQKFEAVNPPEAEIGDVILVKDNGGDLLAPYSVEEITETERHSIVFKIKPTRSDVLGKTRYYLPGSNAIIRRIA